MSIEICIYVFDEETKEHVVTSVRLQSDEIENRIKRVFSGIKDRVLAKDTAAGLAREILLNKDNAIDALVSNISKDLVERAADNIKDGVVETSVEGK